MKKVISIFILLCFLITGQVGTCPVYAQEFSLPAPGTMVPLSHEFNPPILKGLKVHPDNPFQFDFILDKGDINLTNQVVKDESTRLIKYFLASLTIPEKDLWVNLSPYEKNRIVQFIWSNRNGTRFVSRRLYAQADNGEFNLSRKWHRQEILEKVYEEAQKKYGTTNIPVNTFNKVWIVPEKAVVYENAKAGTVYVVESKLKGDVGTGLPFS